MQAKELKEDDTIIEWLDILGAKTNTVKHHLVSMQHYTEYTNKTPLQLLEEAEKEIKQGKLMRQRAVKKQLVGFKKHLNELKLAPLSVKGYLTGVKSFYRF